MENVVTLINATMCGAITFALIWLILNPAIREGVVIKIGLTAMVLGFGSLALNLLALADNEPQFVQSDPWQRSILLISSGITTVIIGYLVRRFYVKHPVRRTSDWADLE